MAIEFRFARRDEYPAVSRFLNDYWAQNHIYVREQSLFDWTFHRASHWEEDTYSVAIAEDAGELVGILGGIPFTLNHFGKTSPAVWIANYVIRPDHRKGVAALKLLNEFRQPPFQSTIAFGINPATSTIYRVLRGEVVEKIPRHVLVMPNRARRMANLLQIARENCTAEDAKSIAQAFEIPVRGGRRIHRGCSIPANWDQVEWPELANRTVGAVRDASYLRWRYMEHPLFEYHIRTVNEGNRAGLLVWRLETVRRAVNDAREDVDRFGRLVEFLPASPANASDLFDTFLADLEEADAIGADFYTYSGKVRETLNSLGFLEADSHPEGSLIPSRFQPLDGKSGDIMSAMFLPAGTPKCSSSLECPWYWTKSDSDQDRPN